MKYANLFCDFSDAVDELVSAAQAIQPNEIARERLHQARLNVMKLYNKELTENQIREESNSPDKVDDKKQL